MSEESTTECLLFPEIFSKPSVVQFYQRQGSSDGGAILLNAAERGYGLIWQAEGDLPRIELVVFSAHTSGLQAAGMALMHRLERSCLRFLRDSPSTARYFEAIFPMRYRMSVGENRAMHSLSPESGALSSSWWIVGDAEALSLGLDQTLSRSAQNNGVLRKFIRSGGGHWRTWSKDDIAGSSTASSRHALAARFAR